LEEERLLGREGLLEDPRAQKERLLESGTVAERRIVVKKKGITLWALANSEILGAQLHKSTMCFIESVLNI
jgi:hypothetical protein